MKMKRLINLFGRFVFNIPFAPLTLTKVGHRVYNRSARKREFYCLYAMFFFTLFILSIVLCALELVVNGIWVIGMFVYLCFCGCMAIIRRKTRDKMGIEGSIIEDFAVSVILYPSVAVQLEMTTDNLCRKKKKMTRI